MKILGPMVFDSFEVFYRMKKISVITTHITSNSFIKAYPLVYKNLKLCLMRHERFCS